MKCEQAKELLTEHLLGSLEGPEELELRRHLRGCSACRAELSALSQGVASLALAAHDVQPPGELKGRVLSALEEEWREAPEGTPRRRRAVPAWIAAAAVFLLLAGSLAWGMNQNRRALRAEAESARYDSFLAALGGEAVRVGTIQPTGDRALEGSAVIYDSKVGQSWVLVLVRAPGMSGVLRPSVSCDCGSSVRMRPIQLDKSGEGSSWLVTGANLRSFNRIALLDAGGSLVGQGSISQT